MKLSTKARYGLRALIEIAKSYGKAPAKRKEIAARQDLSDSYLENLLIVLKNNRFIETTRGINGGYILSRDPSEIVVFNVITALEGPFELADCIGENSSCKKSNTCSTKILWEELYQCWHTVLNKYTIQDLLDKEKILGDADYII